MSSNRAVSEVLAQEGALITDKELLQAVQKPLSRPNPSGVEMARSSTVGEKRPFTTGTTGQGTIAPAQLTPSDLLILKGMPWTNGKLKGGVEARIVNPEWAFGFVYSAMAAALLANEEAGALRLEVVQKKSFFGLFTNTILRTARLHKAVPWPIHSLEYTFQRMFSYDDQNLTPERVSDIICNWIGTRSSDPWQQAALRIRTVMQQRGLLSEVVDVIEKKWLIFSWTESKAHCVLPEQTEALVAQRGEPAQGLMKQCEQDRPEVFHLLMEELGRAFNLRYSSPG